MIPNGPEPPPEPTTMVFDLQKFGIFMLLLGIGFIVLTLAEYAWNPSELVRLPGYFGMGWFTSKLFPFITYE